MTPPLYPFNKTKSNAVAEAVRVEANLEGHLLEMAAKVNDYKQDHSIENVWNYIYDIL